eukprot:TRINITY_DN4880_c0_g1_i6.p1 TRINITY_DN4880_c0_g1~~TRINITY_DN4880_c0_g1_i6.p1  ORF type:complete len:268 (-),score=104.03 TRINITY_DN4880_c0_g1_i6:17-820(-)
MEVESNEVQNGGSDSERNEESFERSPRSASRSPQREKNEGNSPSPKRDRSKSPSPKEREEKSSYSSGRSSRDNPAPSKCLGVFGLSFDTGDRDLKELFGKYGPLEKVELILDRQTMKSRCFGFIYFEEMDDATKARNEINGMKLHGRFIRVDYSSTRRAHSPTPGQYMGRPSHRDRDRRSPRRDRSFRDYGRDSRRDDRERDRGDRDRRGRDRRSRSRSRERNRSDRGDRDRDRSDRVRWKSEMLTFHFLEGLPVVNRRKFEAITGL